MTHYINQFGRKVLFDLKFVCWSCLAGHSSGVKCDPVLIDVILTRQLFLSSVSRAFIILPKNTMLFFYLKRLFNERASLYVPPQKLFGEVKNLLGNLLLVFLTVNKNRVSLLRYIKSWLTLFTSAYCIWRPRQKSRNVPCPYDTWSYVQVIINFSSSFQCLKFVWGLLGLFKALEISCSL